MTAWTATWGPGDTWLHWWLTITDEAGNIAWGPERSHALYATPRPGDGLLAAMGMYPQQGKAWEEGPRGWYSRPLVVTAEAHRMLIGGLLAAGRSDPRGRRPAPPAGESPLMRRATGTAGG